MGQVEVGRRYRERGLGLTVGEAIEIPLMSLWIVLERWRAADRSPSRQRVTDGELARSARGPERQILCAD
jgi:hypothetical protein